jgi:putative tryptophan/tyrosine transport system substrate-binding protein
MVSQTSYPGKAGLMSYSVSLIEQHRAAAPFIDKILRGANAAMLPVEQPIRFELVLNLRTARALSISFRYSCARIESDL